MSTFESSNQDFDLQVEKRFEKYGNSRSRVYHLPFRTGVDSTFTTGYMTEETVLENAPENVRNLLEGLILSEPRSIKEVTFFGGGSDEVHITLYKERYWDEIEESIHDAFAYYLPSLNSDNVGQ